eukprot:403375120
MSTDKLNSSAAPKEIKEAPVIHSNQSQSQNEQFLYESQRQNELFLNNVKIPLDETKQKIEAQYQVNVSSPPFEEVNAEIKQDKQWPPKFIQTLKDLGTYELKIRKTYKDPEGNIISDKTSVTQLKDCFNPLIRLWNYRPASPEQLELDIYHDIKLIGRRFNRTVLYCNQSYEVIKNEYQNQKQKPQFQINNDVIFGTLEKISQNVKEIEFQTRQQEQQGLSASDYKETEDQINRKIFSPYIDQINYIPYKLLEYREHYLETKSFSQRFGHSKLAVLALFFSTNTYPSFFLHTYLLTCYMCPELYKPLQSKLKESMQQSLLLQQGNKQFVNVQDDNVFKNEQRDVRREQSQDK